MLDFWIQITRARYLSDQFLLDALRLKANYSVSKAMYS